MTIIMIYCVGFIMSAFILCFLNTIEVIPDGVYDEIKIGATMLWPFALGMGIAILLAECVKLFFKCIEAIFK